MDTSEEEKNNLSDEQNGFGKVIDALHSKQKLPSLRSYQGDMAEFIKEKNESTMSIALKEKERKEKEREKIETKEKEERENDKKLIPIEKKTPTGDGFRINMTSLALSFLLIVGGVVASLYIFQFFQKEPIAEVILDVEIIPYNNLINLVNVTKENIGEEFTKLPLNNGVNIFKISNVNGLTLQKIGNLLDFLGISLPPTLERTLGDEYAVGALFQNDQKSYFLVLSVDDFGRAFSGMLEWEKTMASDLVFLNIEMTSVSTTTAVGPLPSLYVFSWKDLIIKNKDTRALVNQKNQTKIAYTFLDKNTILITNNLSAIGEMSSAYASRSVAR